MKWLSRLFVFWLILAGVFWFWGAPYLAALLSEQTRNEQSVMCVEQMRQQNIVPTPLPEAGATEFCECLAEPLQFTFAQLMEMRKTQALPPELEAAMQAQSLTCQPIMDRAIAAATGRPVNVPPPADKTNADGSVEIHL